ESERAQRGLSRLPRRAGLVRTAQALRRPPMSDPGRFDRSRAFGQDRRAMISTSLAQVIARGARLARLSLIMSLLALLVGPLPDTWAQPKLYEGTHEGADFLIGMPEKWNGGLVLFAHGYEGEGDGHGSVRASPLSGHLEAR